MIAVLWWFGQNTITIAVMILLVAAACRLFRNRPAVQHVLWAVVLLKFVTPPIVSWPWSVQHVSRSLRSLAAPEMSSVLSTSHEHPAMAVNVVPNEMEEGGATGDLRVPFKSVFSDVAAPETRPVAVAAERQEIERVALGLVIGIWLVGGAVCAARQFRRIADHALLVRSGTTAPEQLTDEVEAIARQVGLRPPRALIAQGITSPFVWFLGRLRLVWPETMSSCDEIVRSRGVIAHELAHVRRGDHWVAWLELVAGLVWWWNPLLWFVRRRIRASAEIACDAIALSTCPDNRRAYAELLLELSAGPKTGAPAPVLGVNAGTPSSFERRLSMILSDRVSGKVSVWGLLTAGFLALAALPGWSLAQQNRPQDGVLSSVVDDQPSSGIRLVSPLQVTTTKAPEAAAHLVETASQSETTAARLQKLEAEIQRLSRLLEQPQQPGLPPRLATDRPPQDMKAAVYKVSRPIDSADPVLMFFKGRGRTYLLTADEQAAYLSALTKEGRQIWHRQFPAPQSVRGGGAEWTLEEPNDKKLVIVTWTRNSERIRFCFHANSGELLTEDVGPNPKSADPKFAGDRKGTELRAALVRMHSGVADGQAGTDLQGARLGRLEKAVDDLRKRLQDPAPWPNSATEFGARYFHAVAELQVARSRVARLMEHKEDAVSTAAELDEARIEMERAEKLAQLLSEQIKADKDAAEAARTTAEANYMRAKQLYERGFASQAKLDALKAALESESARVKQLESILRVRGKAGTP